LALGAKNTPINNKNNGINSIFFIAFVIWITLYLLWSFYAQLSRAFLEDFTGTIDSNGNKNN
jgi:hypothetical protein